MQNILESLDEAIFTPELKTMIQEMYEGSLSSIKEEFEGKLEAVEAEKTALTESLKEMEALHEQALEAKEKELTEVAKEYAEHVKQEISQNANEFAETIKEEYKEKANAYGLHISEHYKGKIIETLDLFLNKAVEDYLEENRLVAENAIQEARLKALLEGFDSLLATGATDLSKLSEQSKESDGKIEAEVAELKESVSKLLRENDGLKKENVKLIKESILKDVTEDMSLVEKDKFEKLANVVAFNESDIEGYKKTLEAIKSNVGGSEEEEQGESSSITESNENKPAWSRFV